MIDHNHNTDELAVFFKEIPTDPKEYLKLRMLQVTELASVLLCADQGNLKLMEFLQKQIPATYRLLQDDSQAVQETALDFALESTDYVSKDDLTEFV